MDPHKPYIIWFTPRTGSTYLCHLLQQCGIAGHPGEYFNKDDAQSLLDYYKLKSYAQIRDHLWRLGCSENGVMGMKYSFYHNSYESISSELIRLQSLSPDNRLDWQIMDNLFPNCRHIFLTRRNKIRLAVSWWKAIQDQQWHLKQGEHRLHSADFYQDRYDVNALVHLLKDHNLRECALQEYFDYNQIIPYTMVYEDFVADVQNQLLKLLDFLQIEVKVLPEFQSIFRRTSDQVTEIWVSRFRSELQKDWDKMIW